MTLNRLATAVRPKLLIPDTSIPRSRATNCANYRNATSSEIKRGKKKTPSKMAIHHLMVGTWTPPGAIFTFAFDDEALTLKLVKRTEIAQDEPISWMTFDVSPEAQFQQKMTRKIKETRK